MITIEIPGYKKIVAEHLVLDYNGTLAVDGILIPGLKDILNVLAEKIRIHVVTADTFGNAAAGLSGIPCTLTILAAERQQQQKARYIKHIGRHKTIAIRQWGKRRTDAEKSSPKYCSNSKRRICAYNLEKCQHCMYQHKRCPRITDQSSAPYSTLRD